MKNAGLSKKSGILTTTILASGMGFFITTAVLIALPPIQKTFQANMTQIQWIGNSYELALATFILFSGVVSDRYGLTKVFNAGILIFTISSLLIGISMSLDMVIIFRILQGFGAALMIPGSLTIISKHFHTAERGKAIGLWAGLSGAFSALGPLAGGVLADFSWRLVFLIMVPAGIITLVMSKKYLSDAPSCTNAGIKWTSASLAFLCIFPLVFGLTRISDYGFDAIVIACLLFECLIMPAFIYHELRTDSPLIPIRSFSRNVKLANLSTALLYFSFTGALFLLSFYLQQFQAYSASLAGLAILPITLCIAFFSGFSGSMTDRVGPRLQMALGPFLFTLGCILIAIGANGINYFLFLFPGIMLIGIGMTVVIPALTKTALDVNESIYGTASSVNNAMAKAGGMLAIAVLGTLMTLSFTNNLEKLLIESGLSTAHISSVLAQTKNMMIVDIPYTLPEIEGLVRQAYSKAFITGMLVNASLSFGCVIISFFLASHAIIRNAEK